MARANFLNTILSIGCPGLATSLPSPRSRSCRTTRLTGTEERMELWVLVITVLLVAATYGLYRVAAALKEPT